MDAKLKARWVKALRSGRFKQGTGYLRFPDDTGRMTFCCLGVLCSITRQPLIGGVRFGFHFDDPAKTHTNMQIPRQSSLGRKLETEGEDYSDVQEILTHMNDGGNGEKPRSFRGIAQWIERNL